MPQKIHPQAIIHDGAKLGENVTIGPYAVIGPKVQIGDNTIVDSHAVIDGVTTIGHDCHIFPSASIGLEPQDHNYKGEETGVIIGNHTHIREFMTIHRATGGGFTTVGDHCLLMNFTHVAHNCKLGNGVIIANGTNLAGYCEVGDKVFISSMCIFHQFTRIGTLTIVGGLCGTRVDLPPYAMTDGRPAIVRGVNNVGLRRAGVSSQTRMKLKEAYRIIYRTNLNISNALEKITQEIEMVPELETLINFYKSSKRGVCGGALDAELGVGEPPI